MNREFEPFTKALRRWLWLAGWVLVIGAVLITVPYVYYFWGHPITDNPTRWSEFGGYFGPMLAAILSFASLVVLVVAAYASSLLPKAFEEKRLRADRIKTTLDISRILYDREFYLYVSAPTWGIAVKWLYWNGQDGDEYRRVVSGTKFLYEETSRKFKLPVEVNSRPYQNLIRFEPHTMPYGYTEPATTISELSEHQVLNIWIQFWCRLQALLEEELVDEHLVRRLFADLYRAWLNFMLELRFVGEELEKEISWFSQIEEIEKVLFQNDRKYNDAVARAKERAVVIVGKTRELHKKAMLTAFGEGGAET